jgi:hypothetical protein
MLLETPFLLQAVKVWALDPLTNVTINPVDEAFGIQSKINQAMASQAHIGWVHFFRGFVSEDWGHIYHAAELYPTTSTQDERRIESEKILKAIIMAAQDYSLSIWQSENAVLQHEAGSDMLLIVHATQLYSLQSTLSPILQSYFTRPLEDRLHRSPRQRKRWLRLARLATSHSSASGSRQQHLSTYFPYALLAPMASSVSPLATTCSHVPSSRKQLSIKSYFIRTAG